MEDTDIVALFLQRDEAAIAQTAAKYGGRLRGLATRILSDETAAEECENDTYHAAWRAIPPHTPRTYLFAFLAAITRHLALDVCRSRSRKKRCAAVTARSEELEDCVPAAENVEQQLDGVLLSEAISRYLQGLDEVPRRVFLRRYWFFDSIGEIGARFGFGESKVKSMLFRCRGGLKKYLEKEGYGYER